MLTIGVAGGSGSGKTTFSNLLTSDFDPKDVLILRQDSYYRPFAELTLAARKKINFDHPESLDFPRLVEDVRKLKAKLPINIPDYSFADYTRVGHHPSSAPPKILIIEGILIFAEKALREEMDIKIFIDTDPDDRLVRRIHRDTTERERALDSVLSQYEQTVKPMHLEFVEPSKRWADVIIPHGGKNKVGLELVRGHMLNRLNQGQE